MTEELDIFNFNEKEVRIHRDKNGKPWFVAADVCKVLGLDAPHKVKERLNPDGGNTIPVIDTLGRTQQAYFINEQNLYKTIFQSRKHEAEKFTDWVTGEVLPSIRKSGCYIAAKADESPEEIMARAQKIADDVLKRREESDRISSSILLSALKGGGHKHLKGTNEPLPPLHKLG